MVSASVPNNGHPTRQKSEGNRSLHALSLLPGGLSVLRWQDGFSFHSVASSSPRLKQVPADNPERALYPQEVDTSMPISLPSPPVWLQMAIVVMS